VHHLRRDLGLRRSEVEDDDSLARAFEQAAERDAGTLDRREPLDVRDRRRLFEGGLQRPDGTGEPPTAAPPGAFERDPRSNGAGFTGAPGESNLRPAA
jgi:hypothetical protein